MKKKSNTEVKVRLNKYISQSGLCSRREADNLIKQGQVKVNGSLCNELGSKVNINDLVQINNRPIKPEKNIYILLNKPKDYITSNKDTQNRKIVFDLIKEILWTYTPREKSKKKLVESIDKKVTESLNDIYTNIPRKKS